MAVVMVWSDLRIRRFTPLAQELFNIRSTDVDRSIADIRHNINIDNSPALLTEAIHHGRDVETEVQSSDGRWFLLRPRPYRNKDGSTDGAIMLRESTCELLAMAGFEVRSAATGHDALEMASRFGPEAILLDVGLPDLSGYDVARRLRQLPQFASTLRVALTGYDTPEAHVMSSAAGFDHHIAKPVNFDELTLMLS